MAESPPYQYMPLYGVEPYEANGVAPEEPFGGGAKVTNDNLIITAWTIDDIVNNTLVGELLKPTTAFPDYFEEDRPTDVTSVGTKQSFSSRTSARINFKPDEEASPPTEWPVILFMNPPAELKSLWANLFDVSNGNARVIKSLIWSAWNIYLTHEEIEPAEGEIEGLEGPLAYEAIFGSVTSELSLARTSGADGNPPEFFGGEGLEEITQAELRELSDALNRGDYFIPVIIDPEEGGFDIQASVTIEWPHSVGRGG